MTKHELWKIYCKKNPQFADDAARFTISGAGLRKLFEQPWDMAEQHTKDLAKAKATFDDLFKDFK